VNAQQTAVFPPAIPLFEAVMPAFARDECGAVGEDLYKLSEALKRRLPVMPQVPADVSPQELWRAVNMAVSDLEGEAPFREVYAQALARLMQNAQQAA
jgi:hypothetical protein